MILNANYIDTGGGTVTPEPEPSGPTENEKFTELLYKFKTETNPDDDYEVIALGITYLFDPVICINLFEDYECKIMDVVMPLGQLLIEIMEIMGLTINIDDIDMPYLIGDKVAYDYSGKPLLIFKPGRAMVIQIEHYFRDYPIGDEDIDYILQHISEAQTLLSEWAG